MLLVATMAWAPRSATHTLHATADYSDGVLALMSAF
jgi:hypothetical protein